jgi:Spy/CpxP family protein refolding chaperone
LHTIETDLSNSFIHLVTALEKMQECLDKNISITKNQKTKIKNLMKISTNALRRIELVGVNVSKIFKK